MVQFTFEFRRLAGRAHRDRAGGQPPAALRRRVRERDERIRRRRGRHGHARETERERAAVERGQHRAVAAGLGDCFEDVRIRIARLGRRVLRARGRLAPLADGARLVARRLGEGANGVEGGLEMRLLGDRLLQSVKPSGREEEINQVARLMPGGR